MATPLGTNVFNSVTRRFIYPEIVDQFYGSNILLYRMQQMNKKTVQGGSHIEVPLLYSRHDTAQWYSGFELFNTTPQDNVKNAAYDWKNLGATASIDGPTLRKNSSPEAVANLTKVSLQAMRMEMEDKVGDAIFSTGSDTEAIEGLRAAVDNGSVAATYGGIGSRTTTNSFWQPDTGALDTSTTTLSLGAEQTVFMSAAEGARAPTIGVTTKAIYNRHIALLQPQQRFPQQPGGSDEVLAGAGFTNVLFNNVPLVVDSHCPASHLFFLNETYIDWVVHPQADFDLGDWQEPVDQDALVAKCVFMGQLVFQNVKRQAAFTALTA